MKYFLYARKSTDDEDRQILSIEAQMTELQEFAAKEKLEIVASFEEAKTAKEPGRTKFGEMLNRIKNGEADGIISWHPDRLARNPIDGGQIIYMVDTGKIKSLKFPSFWFEDTPQGKFMLNIAFGQSKYFVDNLSENVKRGQRQKLRRGEWPGWAPFGYLNDYKNHTIAKDQEKYKWCRKIFTMYATGRYTLNDLAEFLNNNKITNQRGKQFHTSMIQHILQNPFYYGVFRYNGEIYEAKHEPIISKNLFDQVRNMLKQRGKKIHEVKKHGYIFSNGLMKCGSCGCFITAEMQKGHVYYRCTKKKGNCPEKYIREELLAEQVKDFLKSISLPEGWEEKWLAQIDKESQESNNSAQEKVQGLRQQILGLESKLDTLLDSHLEGVVEKEQYLKKKEAIFSERKDTEEKIQKIRTEGNDWLEPMRDFIFQLIKAKKISRGEDFSEFPSFLKNAGSNFILEGRKLRFLAKNPFQIVAKILPYTTWLGRWGSNPRPSR